MADFDEFDDDFMGDDFAEVGSSDDLVAKLEAFERKVDENIKILRSSKDAKERLKAAKWLGDSGAPKAIPALGMSYRSESDSKVKTAAEYALGQFKALYIAVRPRKGENFSDALEREENAHIVQRLEEIAFEGKTGKSSIFSRSLLVRFEVLLGVILIILVGINIFNVINDGDGSSDSPPTEEAPANPALATSRDLRRSLTNLNGIATTLTAQFESVANGGELDCDLALVLPQPVTVPDAVAEEEPDVQTIARRMEASTQQVTNSFNIYNATCTDGVELSSEDIAQAQAFLSRASADIPAILQDASALEARLNQEEVERNTTPSPTPTETLAPTDTPTPTPTFTPEPTATLSPQLINAHTSGLNFILDTVNSRTRGANTLLTQYWNDVTQAGTTDGCRNIRPTIPGDYDVVIEEQVLERFPELGEARDSVNLGLALLRDGWQMFDAACSSGQMIDSAQVGGNIAGAAAQAFTDAQTLLEEVP